MTDYRALCAELLLSWDVDGCDWKPQHQARWNAAIERVRTALAQPEPAGDVSDDELREIAEDLEWKRLSWQEGSGPSFALELARAAIALDRSRQPAPAAVPVAERFPFSKECDDDGFLWLGVLETNPLLGAPHFSLWTYEECRKVGGSYYTHFLPHDTLLLPARAMPLPAEGEVSDQELRELVGRLGWIAAQVADIGWSDDSDTIARAATLLQQLSAPAPAVVPVPVAVSDALIKAECSLSDIAEGEETIAAPNTFKWAEQRCAETLAIIRPVMKQHGIRTSEWPPQPLPQAGEVQP